MKTTKLASFILILCAAASASAQPSTNAVMLQQWDGGGWPGRIVVASEPSALIISNTPGVSAVPVSTFATPSLLASASAALDTKINAKLATSVWNSGSTYLLGQIAAKENAGVAASLLTSHTSASNPHTQYALITTLNSATSSLMTGIDSKLAIATWATGSTSLQSQITGVSGSLTTLSGSFANKLDTSIWNTGSTNLQTAINARLLTTTWTSGSTALANQISSAITTATNFAKGYYVAGANVTIASGTISATGGGGGSGSGGDTGYTPISGNITAPGKYLLTGPITNAIAGATPGMELDLIVFDKSGDNATDYGISGWTNKNDEDGGICSFYIKSGYARVRLVYGTRRYYVDEDGYDRTGWHVIEEQNTEVP